MRIDRKAAASLTEVINKCTYDIVKMIVETAGPIERQYSSKMADAVVMTIADHVCAHVIRLACRGDVSLTAKVITDHVRHVVEALNKMNDADCGISAEMEIIEIERESTTQH